MKLETGHLVEAKLSNSNHWNNGRVMHPPIWIKLCDGRPPHHIDEFEHICLKSFQPINNRYEVVGMNKFLCMKCEKFFSYEKAERHDCTK